MEYITIVKTNIDTLFRELSLIENITDSTEILKSNGFSKIKGGSFSKQIWQNGELLIKFFDTDKYDSGKVFKLFLDYDVYLEEDLSDVSILPKFYGYCENRFMVTKYVGSITLVKGTLIKFNTEQMERLAYDLFTQLVLTYKLTGYVIDDVDGKNIVYNRAKDSFYLVDLSCVCSFSSTYFVREYITSRLNRMFEGFFHKGWIRRNELLSVQRVINELTSNSLD